MSTDGNDHRVLIYDPNSRPRSIVVDQLNRLSLMPNTHRRRNATAELCRVGGVYWALLNVFSY